jgi:hypothetical protein
LPHSGSTPFGNLAPDQAGRGCGHRSNLEQGAKCRLDRFLLLLR